MPTIEIVSLQPRSYSIRPRDFSFSVLLEDRLVSHRGLFQSFLDSLPGGYIMHLANPGSHSESPGDLFGSELIDWEYPADCVDQSYRSRSASDYRQFQFLSDHHLEMDTLLRLALQDSGEGRIVFLTDFQLSSQPVQYRILPGIEDWWRLHHSQGLTWNTAYTIGQGAG